jgi:hypothetical protein
MADIRDRRLRRRRDGTVLLRRGLRWWSWRRVPIYQGGPVPPDRRPFSSGRALGDEVVKGLSIENLDTIGDFDGGWQPPLPAESPKRRAADP